MILVYVLLCGTIKNLIYDIWSENWLRDCILLQRFPVFCQWREILKRIYVEKWVKSRVKSFSFAFRTLRVWSFRAIGIINEPSYYRICIQKRDSEKCNHGKTSLLQLINFYYSFSLFLELSAITVCSDVFLKELVDLLRTSQLYQKRHSKTKSNSQWNNDPR